MGGGGRYTGGAICSIAFNQPEPIVDGNVIRVLTRVAGIEEPSKAKQVLEQIWAIADDLVKHAVARQQSGQRNASAFNQAMMELGALVCTPRNPRCDVCPLKGRCVARKENKTDRIPALAKRAAAIKRRFVGFAILWRGPRERRREVAAVAVLIRLLLANVPDCRVELEAEARGRAERARRPLREAPCRGSAPVPSIQF